jgi:hypothetical protein
MTRKVSDGWCKECSYSALSFTATEFSQAIQTSTRHRKGFQISENKGILYDADAVDACMKAFVAHDPRVEDNLHLKAVRHPAENLAVMK